MAHLLSEEQLSAIFLLEGSSKDNQSAMAEKSGFIRVHVDTGRSDNQRTCFGVDVGDTIGHLKTLVGDEEGVAAEELRLYLSGTQLEDDDTLGDCGAKDDTLLHMALRQSSMLGTFESVEKQADPLIQYLMLPEDQRQTAPVKLRQLRAKAKEEGARPFQTFEFVEDSKILTHLQRDFLCKFLDFLWGAITTADGDSPTPRVDLRVAVPDQCFIRLMDFLDGGDDDDGDEAEETMQPPTACFKPSQRVLTTLHNLHRRVPNVKFEPKIALRMTRGPTNGCINFHCDGPNVSSTAQIPLNQPFEYKGGRLCFFVNDTLHVLRKLPGSLIQHPPGVLHGVTTLTEGTRKSLFVVDEPNGLDEDGVICVEMDAHIEPFLASQPAPIKYDGTSQAGVCVVCSEHCSTHVLVPCGHLCLCPDCVSMVDGPCPVCRSTIQGKHKVYF